MSNPPDPNELLKLLLKQQQENQQRQRLLQQLQSQPQQQQQTYQSPVDAGLLGNLMNYLAAPSTANGGGAPAAASSVLSLLNMQQPQASQQPQQQTQAPSSQLLTLTNILSSMQGQLPQGVSQQQPFHNQGQPFQTQQHQGAISQQSNSQGQKPLFSSNQQGLLPSQQQGITHPPPQPQQQQIGKLPRQQQNNQDQPFSPQQEQGGMAPQQMSIQKPAPPSNNKPNNLLSSFISKAPVNSNVLPTGSNSSAPIQSATIPTEITGKNSSAPSTSRLPPEPVSLLTLQTWNLEQLESHAKHLQECNQPIPNIVKILLDDARHREEKRRAKRISNRKSATVSRARKRQLIDVLTADNAKLRRQALILSYLPDPVIAIGLDGKIKFCSIQVARVLKHNIEDLERACIEDILVPESRGTIRKMIQDLATAENVVVTGGGGSSDSGSGSDENSGQNNSGVSSMNTNAVTRSSDQSFTVKEVDVNGQENVSDSSDGRKGSISKASSNDKPTVKKMKTTSNGVEPNSDVNVDDVMGASVTANNAGAKLSSLMHCPEKEQNKEENGGKRKCPPEDMQLQDEEPHIRRKHVLAPRAASAVTQKQDSQSSSSTESDAGRRAGVNSSEDSGYMEDSNSNESSDDYAEDSSSLSRNDITVKGNRPRPLAPGCVVGLICSDLTTMYCEITSSIRTRSHNDEDNELGIIDHNPKPSTKTLEEGAQEGEKELLLCLRPMRKGAKVGDDLRFPHQVSESSNATSNKSSSGSGSEDKEASEDNFDADAHSTKLQKCAPSDDIMNGQKLMQDQNKDTRK